MSLPSGLVPRLSISCLALALASAPSLAHASTTAPDVSELSDEQVDQLRRLYAKAEAAFDVGSYQAAADSFQRAYDLSGEPDLLFNIVVCYDRLGEFDQALEVLKRFESVATDAESDTIAERRSSLEARQERRQNETRKEVPPPEAVTAPEPNPAPASTPETTGDNELRLMSPAAWALSAVSLVSIGAGAGLAITAQSRRDGADCAPTSGTTLCTPGGTTDAESSRRLALAADVSFAVGGLAGVAALGIIVSRATQRRRARSSASTHAHLPLLGPGLAGWSVQGRF
ncbi:MAG: tetratricopeptide repeat protein [Nannocystaceae bacterium]|nr:tetratricopeptide repeat protein [Nannocystaceae bacterium]